MSKSRVETIGENDNRPLHSEQQTISRISKEGLQVGDILLFKVDDSRMADRFIQFAQRARGISEEDAACVHAAVVTKVTPSGTAVIAHYINSGLVEEPLKHGHCAYNKHDYDVIRAKDDNNNQIKNQIAKEARQPIADTTASPPTYSKLKVIVTFLRRQNVSKEKTRGYVPGYFSEENNREICSSFVARIAKKVQGENGNIESSFMLPGQLRDALKNNSTFELNPVTQAQAMTALPATNERRPEAAAAAASRVKRDQDADPDADTSERKVKRRVRKNRNNDLFPASAESSASTSTATSSQQPKKESLEKPVEEERESPRFRR